MPGPSDSYGATVYADTPAGYWRLGEPSGTTATDASTGGHNGTYTNTSGITYAQTGLPGAGGTTAVLLDGSTGYIDLGTTVGDFTGTSSFSVECWIKIVGNPGVLATPVQRNNDGSFDQGWATRLQADGTLLCERSDGSTYADNAPVTPPSSLSLNTWHHYVYTYNGANMQVYLDGSTYGAAVATSRSISTQSITASIGFDVAAGGFYFPGSIGEVALYSTALSAARILAHYNAGISSTVSKTAPQPITFAESAQISTPTPHATQAVTESESAAISQPTPISAGLVTETESASITRTGPGSYSFGLYGDGNYGGAILPTATQAVVESETIRIDSATAVPAAGAGITVGESARIVGGAPITDDPSSAYRTAILGTAGLAGYWPHGESGGTTLTDVSGSAHNGTFVGTPTFGVLGIPGIAGGHAISGSAYATVGSFAQPGTACTIETWVSPTNLPTTYKGIAGWWDTAAFGVGKGFWLVQIVGTNDVWGIYGNGTTTFPIACTVTPGQFNHIVYTWNGSNRLRIYLNQVLIQERTDCTIVGSQSGAQPMWIGADPSQTPNGTFDGTRDEFAVYSTELDAATIANHYSLGSTVVLTDGGSGTYGVGTYGVTVYGSTLGTPTTGDTVAFAEAARIATVLSSSDLITLGEAARRVLSLTDVAIFADIAAIATAVATGEIVTLNQVAVVPAGGLPTASNVLTLAELAVIANALTASEAITLAERMANALAAAQALTVGEQASIFPFGTAPTPTDTVAFGDTARIVSSGGDIPVFGHLPTFGAEMNLSSDLLGYFQIGVGKIGVDRLGGAYGVGQWTNLQSRLQSFSISRGRPDELSGINAGTIVALLTNDDSAFDPEYVSSPYYPNVKLMRAFRITANWAGVVYTLGYGFATDIAATTIVMISDAQISASDLFKRLASRKTAYTFPQQTVDARLNLMLDIVQWPPGQRNIDASTFTIPAITLTADSSGDSFLSHMDAFIRASQGDFFIAGDGSATYHNHTRRLLAPSKGIFGAGGLPIRAMTASYRDTPILNEIHVQRTAGVEQVASDVPSQNQYDLRPYSVAKSAADCLFTDSQAAGLANWILGLRAQPSQRIDSITLDGAGDDRLWPMILGNDIGDRITINHDLPGTRGIVSQDYYIESIRHDWSPTGDPELSTVWGLSRATPLNTYFQIGVSRIGIGRLAY